MNAIKVTFLQWLSWARVLRVSIGIAIIFEAIETHAYVFAVVGVILIGQGLFAKDCTENCEIK